MREETQSFDVLKKSIVRIANDDKLCLPRALVVALVHEERGMLREGDLHKTYERIRKSNRGYQLERAEDLVRAAKVNVPDDGCGITEIIQFQEYFTTQRIAILVHDYNQLGNGESPVYFNGTSKITDSGEMVLHNLHILYNPEINHYDVITKIKTLVCKKYFCLPCNVGYSIPTGHICSNKCISCFSSPPCVTSAENKDIREIQCDLCKRFFHGLECLQKHVKVGSFTPESNVCEKLRVYDGCERVVNFTTERNHECGRGYCKICLCKCDYNHDCCMAPVTTNESKNEKPTSFVFYDFETQQHETLAGVPSVNIHKPNLCVVQRVCTKCIENQNIHVNCSICGVRQLVFEGDSTVNDFVELVTVPQEKFKSVVCIAHNAKDFDSQFILKHLVEKRKNNKAVHPKIITTGTSIILIQVGLTKFIDSLNFLHLPLSALPSAFGFTEIVEKKGKFPHLCNTPENCDANNGEGYIGPIPEAKFYSPDTMSTTRRIF